MIRRSVDTFRLEKSGNGVTVRFSATVDDACDGAGFFARVGFASVELLNEIGNVFQAVVRTVFNVSDLYTTSSVKSSERNRSGNSPHRTGWLD